MRSWPITVLLVSMLLACTGCAQERGPYGPLTEVDGGRPHQTEHGVTMLDKTVRDAIFLVSHRATRTPAGQIQARVTMRNVFREELWADSRVVSRPRNFS